MSETCFVIMPFGNQFDDIYRDVLIPAIEAAGYKPVRGDSIYSVGPVIDDIFYEIQSASVLVADVTGKNPNVNYELGAAHALKKPVLIISQLMEDIPFDYRHLRAVVYDTQTVTWVNQLSKNIINTLQVVKKEAIARLDSEHSGRKKALFGKWAGKLEQEVEGNMMSIDLLMEIALTRNGIEGTFTVAVPLVSYPLVLNFICVVLYDQFIKFEYVGTDSATIQFGTLVTRLSANGRQMEGRFAGYGSITDRIVTGYVILDKQV